MAETSSRLRDARRQDRSCSSPSHGRCSRKPLFMTRPFVGYALSLLLVVGIYIISFVIIFDLSTPAFDWDEENYKDRSVALGPRPRWVFLRPYQWDVAYDPGQWPFVVYRPLCQMWLRSHGYAPPVEWRSPE